MKYVIYEYPGFDIDFGYTFRDYEDAVVFALSFNFNVIAKVVGNVIVNYYIEDFDFKGFVCSACGKIFYEIYD